MTDLDLISTDDLVDNLLTRFDHSAFVGMQMDHSGPEQHRYDKWWKGNSHTTIGLLVELESTILKEAQSQRDEESRKVP